MAHKYLAGEGSVTYLSKKHGIKSQIQVRNWINAYREFGEVGILFFGQYILLTIR
ncbi:transposase [Lactobacillus sp. DCY120]|uniref:Transposase n=1 Tax=Bombilactobacillus apium TaxID=2675299 RepID=A0A850RBU8_9LACO|nr:transposase [Bombilactobacillus apium]